MGALVGTGGEFGTDAGGAGVEETDGDQDAEAPASPEEVMQDSERDQAEG